MAAALAKAESSPIVKAPWEDQLELVKEVIGAKDVPPAQFELFLYQARRSGLDPLARQIYAIPYPVNTGTKQAPNWETRLTIVTGIDGYRLAAERSGAYAGQDDAEYGPVEQISVPLTGRDGAVYKTLKIKRPEWARVTVYKVVQKTRCAFTATARWDEYFPSKRPGKWEESPFLMLAKCAEALALRKAFPQDVVGLYVEEEVQRMTAEDLGIDHAQVIDAEIVVEPAEIEPQAPSAAAQAVAAAARAKQPVVAAERPDGAAVAANPETGEVVEPDEPPTNPMGGYWLIHNRLGLPPHEGDWKERHHELWAKIAGRVYEEWGKAPKDVWTKLRNWLTRVELTEKVRAGSLPEMPGGVKPATMPGVWAQYLAAKKAAAEAEDVDEYDPFADEMAEGKPEPE